MYFLLMMDVFGQIRHFISLFIQYASWNPSKNVSYLKHKQYPLYFNKALNRF